MNKKILAILCLALGIFSGTTTASADSACYSVPGGPVSWWPGEGTGEDKADGNDGTLIGGISFAPGVVGQAFRIDGYTGKVRVTDSENLKITEALTIEGWVYLERYPRYMHGQILFRGDDRSGLDPYYLAVQPYGAVRFLAGNVLHTSKIPTGRFMHIAATFDGEARLMKVYLDGEVIAQRTTTVTSLMRDLDPRYDPYVGIGNVGGPRHRQPFPGLIDELAIYDRALTQDEIRGIYNAGSAGKCQFIAVDIDIKPGSDPNSININNNGVIPVAILTTDDFDAADVNADTVKFGLGDASPVHSGHIEDIDSDGDIDLVLHFKTQDAGIGADDTEATLTGETNDGQKIEGTDSVRPLDKGGKKK